MIKLVVIKSRSGGMADAQVSKTCDPKDHVGSTPSFGTLADIFPVFNISTLKTIASSFF